MQKSIKHVIFLYMIFLALLFFSGGVEGAASTALYYIAFLLPLCIMLGLYRRDKYEREQERGLREECIKPFAPSRLGFKLTLPLVKPSLTVATVLNIIYVFNSFPIIWTITKGDPAYQTDTLVTYLYKLNFYNGKPGEAAAVSVIGFLILLACASVYMVSTLKKGDE